MSALCDKSAVELQRLIRAKEISPSELVQVCIARIEVTNQAANAVVATDFERALASAKKKDAALVRGETEGKLFGLPILMKDLTETAGLRTTFGSKRFANYVPAEDEPLPASLRREGAIILGKTNTPEFGAGANTNNDVFGPTGNPFALHLSAGGSSGGSAAALALSMAPLATGSDFGGSLRIPAAFCGVVGMRPSLGVVASDRRSLGFATLWADGPMARTVAETALLLDAMARYDVADPLSEPMSRATAPDSPARSVREFRIAFSEDLGFARVDGHIREAFGEVCKFISSECKQVVYRDPDLSSADSVFDVLRAESLLADFAEAYRQNPNGFGANLQRNIEHGLTMSALDIALAQAERTRIYRTFQKFFEDKDILICPAASVSPFPKEHTAPATVEGDTPSSYFSWYAITYALSLTGHPVLTLPCGLDGHGMPFGIQICGPRRGDQVVLAAASALEHILNESPRFRRPIPRPM